MKNKKLMGILMAGSSSMLWGLADVASDVLIKGEGLNSDLLVSSKMFLAGIILLAYSLFKQGAGKTFSIFKNKKDAFLLFMFVLFGMMLMQVAYYKAMSYSNAATATILQFTSPIFIILWVALADKIKPRRTDIITLVMTLVGAALVITKGDITSVSIGTNAFFWGLMSSIANAAYVLLPILILDKYGSIVVVGWGMFLGGLILNFKNPTWDLPNFSLNGWLLYLFVLLLGTVIPYLVYLASLKYAKASSVAMLDSFEPLAATIGTVIIMNLHYGIAELIGTVLIISTVFIMAYGDSKQNNL